MRPGREAARRPVEERPVGVQFKPKFSGIRPARALAQPVTRLDIASLARVLQHFGTGTTYVLASRTFQSATNYKGEMSAAAYAMANTAGFYTNKRMPDSATFLTVDDVQQAILYRKGRSMMGGSGAMRTAVLPHWGEIGVDDIYSGSAKGERYFTLSVLLGDVILVQPSAYSQVAYKIA